MPASAMANAGYIDARIDFQLWSDAWLTAVKPDVVVFQRQIEVGQIEAMRRVRAALPDAFLVYELDDALSAVPHSSHHYGAVPPGVNTRIREALSICDAATVTTEPLAQHLRDLGATDVRVIPNLVPADKLRDRGEARKGGKLRVGFAGGISHAGDLSLIEPAMERIGDAVEWVFFGCRPNTTVAYEFHDGVAAVDYQDKLYSLDLDLALAPLESNFFNQCKSNLRLIEAGACSTAVLAQASDNYMLDAPPVWAFVSSPESWENGIRSFMAQPQSRRRHHGAAMKQWVAKHYTYEGRMEDRVRAWLPAAIPAIFRPTSISKHGGVVVCTMGGEQGVVMPPISNIKALTTVLEDAASAAISSGADLLWMRPGTTLTQPAWERMREEAKKPGVATVSVLGNDGQDAFPTSDRFTPVPADLAEQISKLVYSQWPSRTAELAAPCGAAILINAKYLATFGSPDAIGMGNNAEAALVEWAVRVGSRGKKHVQVLDRYVGALAGPQGLTEAMATRMKLRGALAVMQAQKPTLSAAERQRLELRLISHQWTGPRPGIAPFPSDYATWQGLKRDEPAKMAEGAAIAAFGAPLPDAEWLIFIDDKTELKPGAAAKMIDRAKATDAAVCYADHDLRTPDGLTPVFKPDFDYELFLAIDYVTPVCVVRRDCFTDDAAETATRADFYRVILRAACTNYLTRASIAHVPEVLATVTAGDAAADQAWAVERAKVVAEWLPPATAVPHPQMPSAVRVQRVVEVERPDDPDPKVTIVIATQGEGWMLQPCLIPLLRLTDYPNFNVVIAHNHPTMSAPDLGWAGIDKRVSVFTDREPFNWSRLNNRAAAVAGDSEFLLFLNDDIRLIAGDWLSRMVATAQQYDVGIVGARLLFPQGTVQHVGVICHEGLIGHVQLGLAAQATGYLGTAILTHENMAVTGACMLVKRAVFNEVGGFEERLSHNYNDVAFCLTVGRLGYRIITECGAELTHLGGASRPGPASEEGQARLRAENAIMTEFMTGPDPYWNPNFKLTASGLGVQGLGYEALTWSNDKPDGRDRVLVINDSGDHEGYAAAITRMGAVVFMADVSAFTLRMIAPSLVSGPWDVRDLAAIQDVIDTLQIGKVVLCGLSGSTSPAAPVELLRGLKRLTQPLFYMPQNGEVVCPKLDFLQDGQDCNGGWKHGIGHCQRCVDRYGSPFGHVDVEAWRTAWADIIDPIEESDVVAA